MLLYSSLWNIDFFFHFCCLSCFLFGFEYMIHCDVTYNEASRWFIIINVILDLHIELFPCGLRSGWVWKIELELHIDFVLILSLGHFSYSVSYDSIESKESPLKPQTWFSCLKIIMTFSTEICYCWNLFCRYWWCWCVYRRSICISRMNVIDWYSLHDEYFLLDWLQCS